MITSTSLDSYYKILPDLGEKQKIVFETIKMHPNMSNHDIARFLGWEINTVTPRVKELREIGLIFCSGERLDRRTNRNVMIWCCYDIF